MHISNGEQLWGFLGLLFGGDRWQYVPKNKWEGRTRGRHGKHADITMANTFCYDAQVGKIYRSRGLVLIIIYMAHNSCSSSEEAPGGGHVAPALAQHVPGEPVSLSSSLLEKSAKVLQSLTPVKQFQQHVCTWALFSHDMSRKIETHHYASRLSEDFLQCAVFDSDQSDARLIGVEYIVSDRVFLALPEEEQKLWHSHYYEIREGLWVNPGVPELMQKPELKKLSRTYGKFWCTWQFDRGDTLPLGVPALMMSPQEVLAGKIDEDLIKKRDKKYNISTQSLANDRIDISQVEVPHLMADNWKTTKKGTLVQLNEVDMILGGNAPLKNLA